MNAAIRWRILTLQAVMVVVLAAAGGFAIFEGNFVTGMIRDELVAQQIYFPGTDQVKAGGALDPAVFPAEIGTYAGQQVDNGDKARVYANDFIAIHLKSVAGGMTYSQASAAARANPSDATLPGKVDTLFEGETLRASLLNAYGWYTVGTYTIYAGFGLMLAALVVLSALVFELFVAGRRLEKVRIAEAA